MITRAAPPKRGTRVWLRRWAALGFLQDDELLVESVIAKTALLNRAARYPLPLGEFHALAQARCPLATIKPFLSQTRP